MGSRVLSRAASACGAGNRLRGAGLRLWGSYLLWGALALLLSAGTQAAQSLTEGVVAYGRLRTWRKAASAGRPTTWLILGIRA